jgi:hypothetical protein
MKISRLSANVVSVVFLFLQPREIGRLSTVCKLFARASNMQYIWQDFCARNWVFTRVKNNWK